MTTFRVVSELVAKGAYFALTVLAARQLSRDAFGLFALGSTLGWLIGVVTDGGLQMHVARTIARSADAGGVLSRWLGWRLSTALAGLVVAVVLARAWSPAPVTVLALTLLATAGLCGALSEFFHHVCRALSRSEIESSILIASRLTLLLSAGAVLVWRPSLLGLAMVCCVVAALTTVLTVVATMRLVSSVDGADDRSRGSSLPISRLSSGRDFAQQVLPVGISVVLSALYFRIDILLLEHWQGATAVGTYNAVFRIVEGLRLFPAAALAVALPDLCRAHSTAAMRTLIGRLVLPALAVTALLIVAAPWFVPLAFGRSFADAVITAQVLLLGFPLMTVNYVLTTQLVAWDRQRPYAWLCAAALVINIALNAWLIPGWSTAGAAWATLATEACLFAGAAWLLRQALVHRSAPLATAPAVLA